MLVRSAPLDGGAISTEQLGGTTTAELGSLLDAAPRAGLDLPCRSGDADLWFAEAPAELERAKALCARLPDPRRVPGRCAAPGRALGCLGRRDPRARGGHPAQAAARPPEQGRPGPGPRLRRGPLRLIRHPPTDPSARQETSSDARPHDDHGPPFPTAHRRRRPVRRADVAARSPVTEPTAPGRVAPGPADPDSHVGIRRARPHARPHASPAVLAAGPHWAPLTPVRAPPGCARLHPAALPGDRLSLPSRSPQ